ncbi:methyltransferase domain-containing protein [Botrimarina sp.]|uniref:SAM-dependent methyltransferase n=1 Tax=Botrimarina sp. TaxID=2795802 RepID=UPI0032EE4674
MSEPSSGAVDVARDYYNSADADAFYAAVWGGEDIHVGLYDSDDQPIAEASRRTVRHMASRLDRPDPDKGLTPKTRVLDIGSGYGGAARFLASEYGCHVTALNLSEVENERNRQLTAEQGLADRVDVVDGNFEDLPLGDAAFDVVWSQDAFLHSERRAQVLAEAARVLRPGGQLVFTDPMQSDSCPEGALQPILDRLHLGSLASPAFYRSEAAAVGLEEVGFEDLTFQLVNHYSRVLAETERREQELAGEISRDYLQRMRRGLRHWIDGGREGLLAWGVFHFRR